jgi:inner membrane protein
MTAKTHNAFAVASLVTAAVFFPPKELNVLTLAGSLIAANVGALIPDMDGAGNRLWDLFPAGKTSGKVLRRIFYKHRTVTHSLIGMYFIFRGLEWLLPRFLNPEFVDPTIILWSMMIGYASHLLADGLTEEGLLLLFPINITFGVPPIRSWRIKTGKWFENFVIYPAVWIYVIWLIHQTSGEFVRIMRLVGS